jgi:hypothetical protein
MDRYRNGSQPNFITFRVEPHPPDEYVAYQDEVEVWRGLQPEQSLTNAVVRAAARPLHKATTARRKFAENVHTKPTVQTRRTPDR